MSPSDLQLLITQARENGLRRLRVDGVELEFWEKPAPAPTALETAAIGEDDGMPTEDQLLFMSGIPLTDEEIKARAP